ncbi:hypothetical protein KP509_09G059500 [Ceratopteris richardii]|uniref:Glycosyltransferase 61 catalytic domain-containing protein n=1 Tax=Ceratopteris richardii TaxID=49495 RepID=A0A8T2U0M1_CERRI|nr:hypothetical protein KP509_09G059500 [Ceratopteris richardii]
MRSSNMPRLSVEEGSWASPGSRRFNWIQVSFCIILEGFPQPLPRSKLALFSSDSKRSHLFSAGLVANKPDSVVFKDDALFCNRSHMRTDVCVAKGDVRVLGGDQGGRLYKVLVYAEGGVKNREERIKPYTRKWEESVMKTIDEVKIIRKSKPSISEKSESVDDVRPKCDVQHSVPGIIFSTGGYTGNVYHEFNDGLIPLFITAHKYRHGYAFGGQVVLLLLEYHHWWISKYAEILGQLTNYTIIDLGADKRVHCFPEVTVGLNIHDELAITSQPNDSEDPARGPSMAGFQSMLHAAYLPRLPSAMAKQQTDIDGMIKEPSTQSFKPKLVIISRNGPRALLNQAEIVALAEGIGFSVRVLSPTQTTEMIDIYAALNGCDTMIGVHGAAMTHLLFMRPGATFIQIVALGTDWAAETYYGEPARKLGLRYVQYKVSPRESSLWGQYPPDDPVLTDPDTVNSRGWWETKRVYLEGQNVTVALPRIAAILHSAFSDASNLRSTALHSEARLPA